MEAGKDRRSVEKSAKNNIKKYKKTIDKSENVCYNGSIRKGNPSEAIRKKAENLPHYKL